MKALIIGSRGRLGAALLNQWSPHIPLVGLARPEVDLAQPDLLGGILERHPADVVVNCAGITSLETCEDAPALAHTVNAEAPGALALACKRAGRRLIHISTDYVFDGLAPGLRTEDEPAHPISTYGRTKLLGEQLVTSASPDHVVVRVSWLFGPEKPGFVESILRNAVSQPEVEAVADKFSCPTFTHDLADWLLPFVTRPSLPGGLYHACNSGACSWHDLATEALRIAAALGAPLQTTSVRPLRLEEMAAFRAPRPRNTPMDCSKLASTIGLRPRPWQLALADYLARTHPWIIKKS